MMPYTIGNYGFLNLDQLEDAPFTLLDTGIEIRHKENYDYDNKKRPLYSGYVLQYTLSGYGSYEYMGNSYLLEKNRGFFTRIPEDSRYYLPQDAFGNSWEFFYLHFSGEAVAPFYKAFHNNFGPVFLLPSECNVIQSYLAFHANLKKGYTLKKYEGGEFLYRFLVATLRELEYSESQIRSDYVKRAVKHMEEEFDTLSGIDALAAHLQISNEHLSRIFKQETGTSPICYLTDLRIQRALHYLLNTDITIEAIARQCGFSCGNYFSKVFRKYMGMSPEEYRHFK